jgi:hypothetical protein
VDGINHIAHRTKRCNHHRHTVLDDHLKILRQSRIGFVHDEINAKGCGVWQGCQALLNVMEPTLKTFCASLIKRGKGSDHPRATSFDNQIRP